MNVSTRNLLRLAAAGCVVLALGAAFTPAALAGCGNTVGSAGSFNAELMASGRSGPGFAKDVPAPHPSGSDIVGMWAVEFLAKGNPGGPPDGTPIDAGFSQWHSDGTEIMNSSRPPATGNFCLGVWKKTGPVSYTLTHKVLNFDPNGTLIGPGTIHEDVTLNGRGDSFSGRFTIDLYDLSGNVIAHVAGEITGTRITPD